MSQLCLLEIKEFELDYEQMNMLSKELVEFVNKSSLGIHFNVLGYCHDLINEQKMSFFCLLSSSFLHYNAEFLSFPFGEEWLVEDKEGFKKRYYFLIDIAKIIFSYNVNKLNIYLSEDGLSESKEDFICLNCNLSTLLDKMYNIILSLEKEMAGMIPSICLNLQK